MRERFLRNNFNLPTVPVAPGKNRVRLISRLSRLQRRAIHVDAYSISAVSSEVGQQKGVNYAKQVIIALMRWKHNPAVPRVIRSDERVSGRLIFTKYA